MTLQNLKDALFLNNQEMLNKLKIFLHKHVNLPVLEKLTIGSIGDLNYDGRRIIADIAISEETGNLLARMPDGSIFAGDSSMTDEEIRQMIDELWLELNKDDHHFSTAWTYDNNYHWHKCEDEDCHEIDGFAPHTINGGVITLQPSYEEYGQKTYSCIVCGHITRIEQIPKLIHIYDDEWSSDETNHWHVCLDAGYSTLKADSVAHTWDTGTITAVPTYESEGAKTHTCSICGRTKVIPIARIEWSKDENQHWRQCTDAGYESLTTDMADHTWNTGIITTQPTEESEGITVFTCTVCGQTKTEIIPRIQHNFSTNWTTDDTYHWHECEDENCDKISDKAEHVWDNGSVTIAPTYDSNGEKTYTCQICGRTKIESIPTLTHVYSNDWSYDADTHWHSCTDAGYESLKDSEAAHIWDEGVVTTEPTEENEGIRTFTCSICGQTKTESIDRLTPSPEPENNPSDEPENNPSDEPENEPATEENNETQESGDGE